VPLSSRLLSLSFLLLFSSSTTFEKVHYYSSSQKYRNLLYFFRLSSSVQGPQHLAFIAQQASPRAAFPFSVCDKYLIIETPATLKLFWCLGSPAANKQKCVSSFWYYYRGYFSELNALHLQIRCSSLFSAASARLSSWRDPYPIAVAIFRVLMVLSRPFSCRC
jgi:hypothetical protein